MAMKVLSKCINSKARMGAAGLTNSYRNLNKQKGYATVNNAETENIWSHKPKTNTSTQTVPEWNKLVDAAREALDNSSISQDEKEAVLEDLQRRVDKKPKNSELRKDIRLHFTMAIQQDDVPAALKTFAVTTRLTDPGRNVDAITKDVSVALDEHLEAEKDTKAALLKGLKRSLAAARTAEQRSAVTGHIYKALRQPDVYSALQNVASKSALQAMASPAKIDNKEEGIENGSSKPDQHILFDVAHVQKTMPLPSNGDVPGMKSEKAQELFAPHNVSNTIDNSCARKKLRKTAKTKFTSRTYAAGFVSKGIKHPDGCQLWTCHLRFAIAGILEEQNVVGHGLNRRNAKHAAYLQILSKLHVEGALVELLSKSGATNKKSSGATVPTSSTSTPASTVDEAVEEVDEGPFPTREQYPTASADLFEPRLIPQAIHNACQKQKLPSLETEGEHFTTKFSRYKLTVDIPGIVKQTVVGKGQVRKLAKIDAWVNMVKRMHASGHLSLLFPETTHATTTQKISESVEHVEDIELVTIDAQTMKAEKDAKVEIYNYAASYGLVPEFVIENVQPRTRRSRVGQVTKRIRPAVQVTIRLSELGIEVTSAGKDLFTAEVAAALSFKRQAENRMSSEDNSATPIPAPEMEFLDVDTAPAFFDFYRTVKRGIFLDLEHENITVAGSSHTSTSVTLNGEAIGSPISMSRKKDAAAVAHLCAAIVLLKAEPDLLPEFAELIKQGKGKLLRAPRPVNTSLEMDTLDMMKDALVHARRAGLPDEREHLGAEENRAETRSSRRGIVVSQVERETANKALLASQQLFEQDPALEQLRAAKASLPMSQYRSQVISIAQNLYSIIIGATGSGKTTQVPQILLEDAIQRGEGGMCDIICTQPRRLAATSVAHRVAAERNERLQKSVGYQVRFDAKLPKPAGSITYCTTGILLEQLKHDADSIMDRVSHLVIDEVHERDLNIDFLLIILKKAIQARRESGKAVPKVILMSATLDSKLFAEYLTRNESGDTVPCPTLSVPGRTFPVEERYLKDVLEDIRESHGSELEALLQSEKPSTSLDYLDAESRFVSGMDQAASDQVSGIDWKRERKSDAEEDSQDANEKEDGLIPVSLLAGTIAHICNTSKDDGAILAFLPGLHEITRTEELLMRHRIFGVDFRDASRFKIHALHSQVPPQQQMEVLERPPPGCRKIILSTNIAETSITVPDVKHVIDLGKLRESRYDQIRRITKLQTVWESNSNAKQRAGRAGRVQEGKYYGLYSHERRGAMPAAGLPELLRSDLQTICLSIKAQGFEQSVTSFLDEAIESPPRSAVTSAVDNLKSISAFTGDEKLTSLGRVLSKLPVHPSLGKMILLGVVFRCLDPMLVLGAMDGERSLFVQPLAARTQAKAAHRQFNSHKSDHLALYEAFKTMRRIRNEAGMYRAMDFARDNFLHIGAFKSIDSTVQQIEQILEESGVVPRRFSRSGMDKASADVNYNSDNAMLIKCLFLAGVNPNVGVKNSGKSQVYRTASEQGVLLHPSSLNSVKGSGGEEELLFAFSTLAKSVTGDHLFMRDTTAITPLMVLLFGGTLETHQYKAIEMDGWLPFRFNPYRLEYTTRLVLEFRKALDRVMHSAFKALSEGRALEEDPIREGFARDLAKIVKLEEDVKEKSAGRESWVPEGWGQGQRQRPSGVES